MNRLFKFFLQRERFHDGAEGDTLIEVLIGGAAFAGFICYLLWILGNTPLSCTTCQPEKSRSHAAITHEPGKTEQ